MILVTGANGNAGGAVAQAVTAMGKPVRAIVREGADTSGLPVGATSVTGDLNDPESLHPHLEGVEAAFLLSGYAGLAQTLNAMRETGVARVVLLSSSAAPSGDLSNAIARYHILSERAVRGSGLPWTFLQPQSFMSNTFQWVPQLRAGDVVRAPFAGVRVATIDPDDVGAVAAVALTSPVHAGRTYRLSGPEPLLPADRVATLAQVLERDLGFEAQSDSEARDEMSQNMPADYVDAFMRFFANGELDESEVFPTVTEVTGRQPQTFEAWARTHATAFK